MRVFGFACVVLVVVALGCGDDDGGPDAGSGGASGSGGAGGSGKDADAGGRDAGGRDAGGSGGHATDGSGGRQAPWPSCVGELLEQCPVERPCRTAWDDAGVLNVCQASGVWATYEQVTPCGDGVANSVHITEVRKADGSLCYTQTVELLCSMAQERGTATWANGSGKVVAVGEAGGSEITCSATGETDDCGPFCVRLPLHDITDGYGKCSEGSCP